MRNQEKKEINVVVGSNIKFYREQACYTREKFGELLGISPRFLASVENGAVGISLTTLKRMCELLGISSDRILWSDKKEKTQISEMVSHLEEPYIKMIENLLQAQLEVIAIVKKKDTKTRT